MAVVIVVEPHTLLRLGILQILADMLPDVKLEGSDYSCLLREASGGCTSDLVLLSVPAYEKANGMVHAAQRAYAPKCILLLSDADTIPYSSLHLPAVVAGYLPKNSSPDVLSASIKLALAGGKCFPLQTENAISQTRSLFSDDESTRPPPDGGTPDKTVGSVVAESEMLGITPRQYEVLVLLARGYPIKTIGRQLNISVATAKAHTETLYQRLDVHNRNQAVYTAVSRGATLGWHKLDGTRAKTLPTGVASMYSG